jgi:putative transcriptional regulator
VKGMALREADVVAKQSRKATLNRASTLGLFFACVLLGSLCPSAEAAPRKDSNAVFLVARHQVQDPYFRQSVVLMLPLTNGPLIVGLIVNKPTRISLGKLFPGKVAPESQFDHAYFGGPVHVYVPCVVLRASTAPNGALRLYGNVYLTFDSHLIASLLRKGLPSSSLRLFLGRAQWLPEQLKDEMSGGGWYRVETEGDIVFSSDPNSLWRTLHDQAGPSKYIKYELPAAGSSR